MAEDKKELLFYDDEINGVSKLRNFILDNDDIKKLVFSRNGEIKKVFVLDESAE